MAELIEGRNAVLEALRSGVQLERIMLADGTKASAATSEIVTLAASSHVPVEHVARAVLDSRSARGAHQGVMALAAPFRYAELGDVIRSISGKPRALIVVLDHVTDPGNLGAVIRSVEVAGGSAVVIPRERSASVGPIVHKASAGATAHLPVVRVSNIAQAIGSLVDAGMWVCGADERAESDLWHAPIEGRLALVMGAEGAGLSRLVRERCDFLVSIPVAGSVASLNVAQATSVLAFEWVRRG
ncbi:MAG: 23S rRNA (guanosine(2251)-2'-O)-methyltransferase RlmB [Coriobacteriia bacterium]|nr:23S rRNA (guanosine(2251)-2'-O)-methyltransferase RlmB [Coriobacteriia bacterium]MBN2839937.1 23S rRNA (guanosine(2251)-2'-O)-methyltransferase RlmB [Coriobacteriia bacterium]